MTKAIIVETDASDFVSAGVLSQDFNGVLHPITFFSKKHLPAECNYEIYDKELLTIVRAFETWRAELEGSAFPISVITDHRNLEYYMTTKQLSRRQARWSEYLSRFNFIIQYRPGKQGGKPDALTRRSQDLPTDVSDERIKHQDQIVLKAHNLPTELHNLHAQAVTSLPEQRTEPLEVEDQDIPDVDKMMTEAYKTDPVILDLAEAIRSKARLFRREGWKISLASCELRDGRVYHNSRLVVPADDDLRLELLRLHHDAPISGHPGRSNTYKLLARSYFWPLMGSDVARYVRNCTLCRRTKNLRQSAPGLL